MKEAIDAMEKAFIKLSSGEGFVPERYVSSLRDNGLIMLFKPAAITDENKLTIKILTQRQKGSFPGIPLIMGIVLVMDATTGELLSIMDGEYLTALRTGAASGLATRHLARKDAVTMALFGCGAQGKTQLEAVACVRNLEKVWLFERDRNIAEKFLSAMKNKFSFEMEIAASVSILKEADIICTATGSAEPLFSGNAVKKGVHINAIGSFRPEMQELDPCLVRAGKVYVDVYEPCLNESGDLLIPIKKGIIPEDHIVGEIGEYLLGKIRGRINDDEITIFKSVGVAIQDYVVATEIYRKSFTDSFGAELALFE